LQHDFTFVQTVALKKFNANTQLCGERTTVPRRSAEDAAKTRRRILDIAERLFTERGFANVSTSAISSAAGVTDGALFHHFRSKKELFSEIAVRLHTNIHKAIYRAGLDAPDPIDGFIRGARKSVEITQLPHNQRIVFIEGPVVLGTEKWRQIDQQLGLRLIEGGLLSVAGVAELPARILKPMAMLALGAINEITYALIRKEVGVDPEQCLDLLVRALRHWVDNDVKTWKASQTKPQK
jgi:AcrR family transcriptional regulator